MQYSLPLRLISSANPLINNKNDMGDIIHPCLTPTSISKKFVVLPFTNTQLSTLLYIFLMTLHIFPLIPYLYIFIHSPSLHTLSYAFCISRKQQYVFFGYLFLITSYIMYNWSTVERCFRNPACSSTKIPLPSTHFVNLSFNIVEYSFPSTLNNVIPLYFSGSYWASLSPPLNIGKISPLVSS